MDIKYVHKYEKEKYHEMIFFVALPLNARALSLSHSRQIGCRVWLLFHENFVGVVSKLLSFEKRLY